MSFPRMSNIRCFDNAASLDISLVLEPTTIVLGDRYCPTHNCRRTVRVVPSAIVGSRASIQV